MNCALKSRLRPLAAKIEPRQVRRRTLSVFVSAALTVILGACSPSGGPDSPAAAADSSAVPSGDQSPEAYREGGANKALSALKLADPDNSVLSVRVTSVPDNSLFAGMASPAKPLSIPFQARRQLLIQLRPGLATEDIQSLLDKHNVEPVKVMPEIGLVVAQLRGAFALQATAAVQSVGDIDDLALFEAIDQLSQDSRVQAAAPNSVLSTLQLRSAVHTAISGDAAALAPGERQDWGMDDAHIAEIWPRLPPTSQVGVIDVGFATHEDLHLKKGLEIEIPKADHGNHVAGILCAKHNDVGVRGVLTNCTVVYATAEALLTDSGQIVGGDEYAWFAYFSDYIASVLTFINKNPDVKVINLSLGYNWLPNFNKDPRLESRIKNVIMSQGRIYMSMLEAAAASDIAIVSAAGNDSQNLEKPLEARWASPFNFGSSLMLGARGWSNGLVVEAHDKDGKRAPFSNVGGDISCPGVNILSTTATSESSTSVMSGTSMASPYCAGALAALREILPDISLKNAVRCLRRSPRNIGGVPALDLKYAIDHCTNDPSAMAREERDEAIRRWSSVLSGNNVGAATASPDVCSYRMRREFTATPVADLGDGQGPEFSDAGSRTEVRNYVAQVRASNCRLPALITLRFGFDAAYQQRLSFALAVLSEFNQAQYSGGAMLVEVPQFGRSNEFRTLTDRVVVILGDANLVANLAGKS